MKANNIIILVIIAHNIQAAFDYTTDCEKADGFDWKTKYEADVTKEPVEENGDIQFFSGVLVSDDSRSIVVKKIPLNGNGDKINLDLEMLSSDSKFDDFKKFKKVNYYECVYDAEKSEIYEVTERRWDNLENKRDAFLELPENERFKKYSDLVEEIFKIRKSGKLHYKINPKKIMISWSLSNTDYNLSFFNFSKLSASDPPSDKIDSEDNVNLFYYRPFFFFRYAIKRSFFLDIYSLMISIANIEFGEKFYKTRDECYDLPVKNGNKYDYKFDDNCKSDLKKNLSKGSFCKKFGKTKKNFCQNEYRKEDDEDQEFKAFFEKLKEQQDADDFVGILMNYVFYNPFKNPKENDIMYNSFKQDMKNLSNKSLDNQSIAKSISNQSLSNKSLDNQSINQSISKKSLSNKSLDNQSINKSIANKSLDNQSINQSLSNQSINKSIANKSLDNQSINQSLSNQSINKSIANKSLSNKSLDNQSINQSISNPSINQSISKKSLSNQSLDNQSIAKSISNQSLSNKSIPNQSIDHNDESDEGGYEGDTESEGEGDQEEDDYILI